MRAAEAYFEAGDFAEDSKMQIRLIIEHFSKTVASRGGKPTPDTQAKIADIVAPDFQPLLYKRKNLFVAALVKYVSTADLNELTRWVTTPIGQRLKAAKNSIISDVQTEDMDSLQDIYIKAWRGHKDEFGQLGLSFAGGPH